MPAKDDYLGHRKRMREKFLKSGLAGFQDYEIVELLLSLGTPRRDCKPQAKEAMRRFKSLRSVLEASSEELLKIDGIGPHSVFGIKFTQAVAREFLKKKIMERPICNSSQEIFDYYYHSLRDLKKEAVKAVFLNSQNQIIDVQDLSQGTVDSSVIFPREVMESAIRCHAVSLVLVHNHPSGNPSPSESDKTLTRDLVKAGMVMQIKLLDHIIIGDNRYFSFAGQGFIEQCELDFLNKKSI